MAEKWVMKPKAVLISWIRALDPPAVKETLSDWEQHFVASVSFQLERSGTLSPKQQELLEKIYAEKSK